MNIANPTVREVLRTGDVDGLPLVSSDTGNPYFSISSLSTVIRSQSYLLFVLLNTDASGYNNLLCHVFVSDHWKFKDHTIASLQATLTPDVQVTAADVSAAREVVNGELVPLVDVNPELSGTTLTFTNVALTGANPLRLVLIPYTVKG